MDVVCYRQLDDPESVFEFRGEKNKIIRFSPEEECAHHDNIFKEAYLIFQTGAHHPERIPSRYKTAGYPNNSGLCLSLCPQRLVPLESTVPEPL